MVISDCDEFDNLEKFDNLDKFDNLEKLDIQIWLSQYLSKNALSKRVTAEGEVLPYHQEELDVSRIGLKSLFSSS